MSEALSVVVTPLVEKVIKDAKALIKENYQLLKGVEKDVEQLTSRLTRIQAVLQDAESKQQKSSQSQVIRDWLGKLKEFAYDSEDVLETLATEASLWQMRQKVRLLKPPFPSARQVAYKFQTKRKVAYKLNGARAIKELLERLSDIEEEKKPLNLNADVSTATPLNRNTTPVVHDPDIVGRESDKNNIINMLLSEESETESNISVIPIIGMGGIGKTALAQLIFNDERVESHFKIMMWVCVTENYDLGKILKDMIESHSKMKLDVDSLPQLESRVLEFLEGNCFLLVLDDVWKDSFKDWKSVEKILEHGGKGSKVLVTTRFSSISNFKVTKPPHHLEYLPKDQCWSIFEKIAFDNNSLTSNKRRNLENIGKQIVEKCKGLPLAVRLMGGFLRVDNRVEIWRRILQDDIWEVEEYNTRIGRKPKILPVLRLSYDHLPSVLKQCFAYCCLFPKAHVFHKMELIKLWKAASLIKLDDIGSDYCDELLSRSLFQVSNVDDKLTFRMHDLIHDLALSVSTPDFYQIRDNRSCSIPEKVRHIAMLSKDAHRYIMDDPSKFRKLRTLVSPVEYSRDLRPTLNKIFHTWKCVRTLDLSSSMITKLPESIGELKLLHYLDLSKTEIRKLPNSLCKLYNLQTLMLQRCVWLFELPKDFCNLANLEHLELDDMFWHKSFTLPSNIGSLKNLQNLHAFRLGQKRGYGIQELKNLLHLKGTLHISRLENATKTGEAFLKDKESLVKVIYEWSSRDGSPQGEAKDREMLDDLQPHPNIEEIEILHYQGNRLPSWLRHSAFQKLTTLSLKHCTNCIILSLGELPHLWRLRLKGLVELDEWSNAEYPNLRRLEISSCPKLKRVPSHFLNLNVLKIKKCDSLEALPLTPFLQFLILVDNLVLKDFNEQKVHFININDQGERMITERPSFLSLLEMKVINCSKLPELPKEFAPQKLEISGCPLFTTLPKSEFAGRLQHLAIDTCDDGRLVRAIPSSSSLYSLVISNIQNLSSLPKLSHLPGLKTLYIDECNELVSLSDDEEPTFHQGLNSLQLLSIRGCPKLETLPENMLPGSLTCLTIGSCSSLKSLGSKDVLKKLTSLTDLCIEHCPELESLPEEGFPISLQHLRIQGCPLLMSRYHKSGPDWPKIKDIPDLELESINEISSYQNSRTWYQQFVFCNKG